MLHAHLKKMSKKASRTSNHYSKKKSKIGTININVQNIGKKKAPAHKMKPKNGKPTADPVPARASRNRKTQFHAYVIPIEIVQHLGTDCVDTIKMIFDGFKSILDTDLLISLDIKGKRSIERLEQELVLEAYENELIAFNKNKDESHIKTAWFRSS
eukprot:150083_1